MLICVRGDVFPEAFRDTPSLILDCGNRADPHKVLINEELLHRVYVINVEAIYRFREALRQIPDMIEELKVRKLIITEINALFSYDDSSENFDVLENCWELMKAISEKADVFVGLSKEIYLAAKFSDRIISAEELYKEDGDMPKLRHADRQLRHKQRLDKKYGLLPFLPCER